MIKRITIFFIIFFRPIFQQLKSQISKIYQSGYNTFCDETLQIYMQMLSSWTTCTSFFHCKIILVHKWTDRHSLIYQQADMMWKNKSQQIIFPVFELLLLLVITAWWVCTCLVHSSPRWRWSLDHMTTRRRAGHPPPGHLTYLVATAWMTKERERENLE